VTEGKVLFAILERVGKTPQESIQDSMAWSMVENVEAQQIRETGLMQETADYQSVVTAVLTCLVKISTTFHDDPHLTSSRMLARQVLNGIPIKVLDIGASPINDPPYLSLKKMGYVDVIGFEPNSDEYSRLKPEGADYYYNTAIGDGQTHNLKITKSPGFTSLYDVDLDAIAYLNRWQNHVQHVDTVAVDTVRLSDLPNLPPIDLLKMDIQGAEAMVLNNAPNVLNAVICVIVEVGLLNIYKPPACRFSTVHDTLLDSGFIFHKFLFLKSHVLRPLSKDFSDVKFPPSQAIDGDAVYIKDLRDTKFYDNATLGKLALISDSIIKSPDLALRCLELLGRKSDKFISAPEEYARLYQAWSSS
jgi:FkbM family methyltransferase